MKSSNIADELNGCLFINEIAGLQYFSLKSIFKEKSKHQTTVYQKACFIFYLSLLFAACYFAFEKTAKQNNSLSSQNVLSVLYKLVNGYCFLIGYFTGLIQSYKSTPNMIKFFMNTQSITEWSYRDFNFTMNFAKVGKAAWYRLLGINLLWVVPYSCLIYVSASSLEETAAFAMFGIFFVGFAVINAAKYVFYVLLIDFQLKNVQKLLQSTFKPQSVSTVGKVYHLTIKDNFGEKVDKKMNKLLVIWKMYNKIIENASLVNKSMGLTMMFVLMNAIMGFIYSGYELIIGTIGGHQQGVVGGK